MSKTRGSVRLAHLDDGYELCYRNWLRGQTCRHDAIGRIARNYVQYGQLCLHDEEARQEYERDVWYSDKRPDD